MCQMSFLIQHDQSHVYYVDILKIVQVVLFSIDVHRGSINIHRGTETGLIRPMKFRGRRFLKKKKHTQKGSSDNSPLFCSNNDETQKQSVSFLEKKIVIIEHV